MSEDDNKVVTLKVRVTPEFREKLVNTAKENNRSMNAEIVDRLEQSFENNRVNVTSEQVKVLISETIKETINLLIEEEKQGNKVDLESLKVRDIEVLKKTPEK